MAPVELRDRYFLNCPRCKALFSCEPSPAMRSGHNQGIMRCAQCKALLKIRIDPDLTGSTMVAEILFGEKEDQPNAA